MTTTDLQAKWERDERGVYRSFVHPLICDGPCDYTPPEGYEEIGEWNNGYRAVWVNRTERAILTYCEGDLDLTVDPTEDEFNARLDSARKFYEKRADMENDTGFIVYPNGTGFDTLANAIECARLDSNTPPDYEARVEDCDTETILARFQHGLEVSE